MKSLFLLFSLFIISNSIPGGWIKASFRENDLGIDRSYKKAFEIYSKQNPNSDIDFTQPLTIYKQMVNGINYLLTFIDLKSNLNVIQEYKISGPNFANKNSNQEFTFLEKNIYKPKKGLISEKDAKFPRIQNTLYGFTRKLNDKLLYIIKVENVEATFDNIYIVTGKTENSEHIYAVGQNKENNDDYEVFGIIQ